MPRRVTWLGHSSVLIEAGGARLLTDPVLRLRVMHLRRHAPLAELPDAVDAVLLSHLHHDHADLPTLRRLPAGTRVLAPRGARDGLRRLGASAGALADLDVQEVEEGDVVDVAGTQVRVVHASHPVRRLPWGPETPALGFIADEILFPGDTDEFPEMASFAPLAAALLPVWGWGPTLGPGHLDPEEAARTLALLRPAIAVPIHWGTFLPMGLERRHGHLLHDPPEQFRRHAERLAPEVRVVVPQVGVPIEV